MADVIVQDPDSIQRIVARMNAQVRTNWKIISQSRDSTLLILVKIFMAFWLSFISTQHLKKLFFSCFLFQWMEIGQYGHHGHGVQWLAMEAWGHALEHVPTPRLSSGVSTAKELVIKTRTVAFYPVQVNSSFPINQYNDIRLRLFRALRIGPSFTNITVMTLRKNPMISETLFLIGNYQSTSSIN